MRSLYWRYKAKKITFKNKHIQWHRYNTLFKKLQITYDSAKKNNINESINDIEQISSDDDDDSSIFEKIGYILIQYEDILNKDTKTRFKYNDSNKFWPLLVNKNPNKKEVNSNYIILDNSEIKNKYKLSLNLNKKNENLPNIRNKKEKKTT